MCQVCRQRNWSLTPSLPSFPAPTFSLQTSTSLQHVPYDLAAEPSLPASPPRPLAFAVQKLRELSSAAAALHRSVGRQYFDSISWSLPGIWLCMTVCAAAAARLAASALRREMEHSLHAQGCAPAV